MADHPNQSPEFREAARAREAARVARLAPGERVCARCGSDMAGRPVDARHCGPECSALQKRHTGHRRHLRFRGPRCTRCGFDPLVPDQLCVHHADENHSNNAPSNLVTLCLNCHALTHAELRKAA